MVLAKLLDRPTAKIAKAVVQPATTSPGGRTKTRRYRRKQGFKVLREICRYQKTTELLLSKSQFQRLVREIAGEFAPGPRFQAGVIASLQEISEANLVRLFRTTNNCAQHANRIMIVPADMSFACGIL